ncbi:extracellular solute-binding protein [Lactonifactor sp. BIOML-A3]|uniref:ABC transporter substrate-binding protein n=1 Tax=unclassified Lactonifactor TaxID=2636670 RepID=UPI0012AF7D2F|nr:MULTISPECIES: ABC transporter substrate-binding protein [unclassified Lactonifactor]MSA02801.1 extracellular solute-binding protein [Lactonifactor sp. BIOML-A5]MSA09105.1 extracellular solute-binding protein [Lactonifactor sp. BIOML-A4]MSA13769.1 extracellular solute-binding protein [Lactonifactor sp. BIOML-A3]MSA18102.1 extracellular solute-binding protein [Lactonifactor sp. BIOML-A2]MSA39001.1 extracellular solute-binding protein [Lactonifactor sp. BIOML-A1]
MKKKVRAKGIAGVLAAALAVTTLSGCRFGFASDPDDPNEEVKEVPIDTSTDTFTYDASLEGTEITLLNSKAEIQAPLEKMSAVFEEKSKVHVEVMPVTDGDSPYTKVVSMYNSGTPPTMAILDTTDVIALAEEKAADLTGEAWTAQAGEYLTEVNGKVYSFPLCIEGRGLIYNKAVIEEALGEEFDPKSIGTLDNFVELLEKLKAAGIEKPVSLAKEDWSLGAHHLQYIYETYDGTSEGAQEVIQQIKDGECNLDTYDRLEEFLDMFDVLKKYNVAKGDPLGADYDEMAIDLADGKTAFWFNGNWAWPNLTEAGAGEEEEYGFLPYFLNSDADDFVNKKIQASPSKQVMLDGQIASEKEQAAAREFLNWIVFSEIGQQMLVKTCNVIPPFINNPYEPTDPLSADIYEKVQAGETYNASAIVPNDHWAVLGAAMQKYLAGRSGREELTESIAEYWKEQK